MRGNLYYNVRNSCFPCLLALPLISSIGISPFASNSYNHKCARLISFGYESMEFVFMFQKPNIHLIPNHHYFYLTNKLRKGNLTNIFKLTTNKTVLKNTNLNTTQTSLSFRYFLRYYGVSAHIRHIPCTHLWLLFRFSPS